MGALSAATPTAKPPMLLLSTRTFSFHLVLTLLTLLMDCFESLAWFRGLPNQDPQLAYNFETITWH